jgi:hydroxymethylbilane synthase
MTPALRIGTRGSHLALAQAAELKRRLAAAFPELAEEGAVEIAAIRTSGDRLTGRPLAEEGGKGLFTKEIEEALCAGRIDLAVHSMKDMTAHLPEGLVIACHLPRADPCDAFVSPKAASLAGLLRGASLGTDSLRRKAQALYARPDLKIVALRGNVETRLAKLDRGAMDATILAAAGLQRLGLAHRATAIMESSAMLPAPAQGVIAVERREGDERAARFARALDHEETAYCAMAERAFFAALDGNCRTPLAALANIADGRLFLDAMIIKPDGSTLHRARREGAPADAARLGSEAGAELKSRGGPGFFA